MSDEQRPGVDPDDVHDDLVVASLLRMSGPREPVPDDHMQRLKTAAHADWARVVVGHRRRRMMTWAASGLAAAAAVVLALKLTGDVSAPANTPLVLATVEALSDAARLSTSAGGRDVVPLRIGDRLSDSVDVFTTGSGTATLRLMSGGLLSMSSDTVLRLPSADAVVLTAGAVFIDSKGTASVEVRTRFGVVHDIGTQFEVSLTSAGLRVRVREGAVLVKRDQQTHDAHAGDDILLDADGQLTRRAMSASSDWAWGTWAHPSFELEGRSLREFLDWVVEEMGWQLQFATPAAEDKASTTTLHGSIRELTAEEALAAVLPTSGVEHQMNGKVLLIRISAGTKD